MSTLNDSINEQTVKAENNLNLWKIMQAHDILVEVLTNYPNGTTAQGETSSAEGKEDPKCETSKCQDLLKNLNIKRENGETPGSDENPNPPIYITLEQKRSRLLELFQSNANTSDVEVLQLMKETYPLQCEAIANASKSFPVSSKALQTLFENWPYLKKFDMLIFHASILLGKDISTTWKNSLEFWNSPIKHYLLARENEKQLIDIRNSSSKEASQLMRVRTSIFEAHESRAASNGISTLGVIFTCISNIMDDNPQLLYRVENSASLERVSLMTEKPILIILGKTFYDSSAKYYVVLKKNKSTTYSIEAPNFIEGMLVTVLFYQIIGYPLPQDIKKTLQLIERMFLEIEEKDIPNLLSDVKKFTDEFTKYSKKFEEDINKIQYYS